MRCLTTPHSISTRIRERLQAGFVGYRAIPVEALERSLRLEVLHMLSAARAGRDEVSDVEVAELAEIGETRAREGVPVEVMLWAWRVGIQLLIDRARELGPAVGADPGCLLDFAQSLLAWADVALLAIAAAHRRTELELARREQEHRGDLVRGVLFGTVAPGERRGQLESYGVDSGREYVAVRARPADRTIERALGFHEALQHRRGLSAIVDGDLVGFLRERPAGEPLGDRRRRAAADAGPPCRVLPLGHPRVGHRRRVRAEAAHTTSRSWGSGRRSWPTTTLATRCVGAISTRSRRRAPPAS